MGGACELGGIPLPKRCYSGPLRLILPPEIFLSKIGVFLRLENVSCFSQANRKPQTSFSSLLLSSLELSDTKVYEP